MTASVNDGSPSTDALQLHAEAEKAYSQRLSQAVSAGCRGGESRRPSDYGYVDFAGVVWISESDQRTRWHALSDAGRREVVASHDQLPPEFAPYFRIFSREVVSALRRAYLTDRGPH
ncbi:putative uncharacterized protein [Mycolicibacterium fortuitum subsp. acetamidolyticum]|uniref:Uncharacterized protein n=1 Tax=Mycolicibacterium fortuitum subsp. acetamidolyticum TaxID=144550 RepID=A0A117IDL3_MYCFO|nr:putative uncharacterized protein [Mycolicibacterium fortuitum subsp. acetamidolyticum]